MNSKPTSASGKYGSRHPEAASGTCARQASAGAHRARARKAGAGVRPVPSAAVEHRRARKGEWENAYFDALSRGHVKASAAGIAGVSERCIYKRASVDPDFAAREWIAYHRGTAALMDIAFKRITDPMRPADNVLIHLLAVRGLSSKNMTEHSVPDGGSVEAQRTISVDKLSLETKLRIMAELEAIEGEVGC